MADGGITEAALLAAAAEGTAAAGSTAAATAAALAAAEAAAAAGAVGTTAATAGTAAAAAAAPELAAAALAPELAAAAVPEAIIAAAPEAVTAATVPETLFLGPTVAEPVVAPTTGVLGTAAETVPVGTEVLPSSNLLGVEGSNAALGAEQFGPTSAPTWLDNAWANVANMTTGEKLQAGGKALSGISTIKGLAGGQDSGGKHTKTITQGKVGQPSGGERQLAEIVEALLKRKDAYSKGALSGQPVLYQPRGLLG